MTYGDYPDLTRVKKILVIKLRQLGDVLLTGAVFHSLKKRFPDSKIDAYVYTEAFDLLDGNPNIHEIIGYDRSWKKLNFFKKLKKEWDLLRLIRKKGYDLVINLTEGDRGALASKMSKSPIRVGFLPKGKFQKNLYTHVVKHTPSLKHTVERNLDALRRIGIFPPLEDRKLILPISNETKERVKKLVDGPFVLIHPTSRWRFKCLPTQTVREVTEKLLKLGKKVVFTGGTDKVEAEMIGSIVEGLDVLNLCGKITLKELGALIEMSDLLFCVDSVPFHMASALKKRVVAVFGPTSDVTWGPWQNPFAKVIFQNFSCRPCYQDGCGGSKMSDCLATLPPSLIFDAMMRID